MLDTATGRPDASAVAEMAARWLQLEGEAQALLRQQDATPDPVVRCAMDGRIGDRFSQMAKLERRLARTPGASRADADLKLQVALRLHTHLGSAEEEDPAWELVRSADGDLHVLD